MSDLGIAITFVPNYAAAFCSRGILRNMQENWSDAIADFDKAILINPRFAEAYSSE